MIESHKWSNVNAGVLQFIHSVRRESQRCSAELHASLSVDLNSTSDSSLPHHRWTNRHTSGTTGTKDVSIVIQYW